MEQIEGKVRQAEELSHEMTVRTQEINNLLVKTRSDATIKAENVVKELSRINVEIKAQEKATNSMASTIPILS